MLWLESIRADAQLTPVPPLGIPPGILPGPSPGGSPANMPITKGEIRTDIIKNRENRYCCLFAIECHPSVFIVLIAWYLNIRILDHHIGA
jgi:hypothetical protein